MIRKSSVDCDVKKKERKKCEVSMMFHALHDEEYKDSININLTKPYLISCLCIYEDLSHYSIFSQ